MFRVVVALILVLTLGWKFAAGVANNRVERDDFKHVLVEFLIREHFEVFDANDANGVEATAGDCRLLITWTDVRVWKQDIIKDVAAGDRAFFVYRQAVYTELPMWSIVANQYWSSFLRKVEFKRPIDTPVFAVIAPARCNAERLPWGELESLPFT